MPIQNDSFDRCVPLASQDLCSPNVGFQRASQPSILEPLRWEICIKVIYSPYKHSPRLGGLSAARARRNVEWFADQAFSLDISLLHRPNISREQDLWARRYKHA